jgi:GntR family transcriptional regulator, transcriptional repressor for pyruvate dehydrogenase complex
MMPAFGAILMQPAFKQLSNIKRTSLVDEVIASIQGLIGDGTAYAPGTRLPSEYELARQLGVGRSTIREALRVLTHLGLVEARNGLGTYIAGRRIPKTHVQAPLDRLSVQHIFEFRHGIELPCARLAAERRTGDQMRVIRESWGACRAAIEMDRADEFARLDTDFHFAVLKASGNPFYVECYSRMLDVIKLSITPMLQLGPLEKMLHFHDNIVESIELQDVEGAARAVEENFAEAHIRLRMLLDPLG